MRAQVIRANPRFQLRPIGALDEVTPVRLPQISSPVEPKVAGSGRVERRQAVAVATHPPQVNILLSHLQTG